MTYRRLLPSIAHTLLFLLHHFEVYTCAECGDALPAEQVLCRECRMKLIEEMRSPCSRCGAPQTACGCLSDRKSHPFSHVVHIAPYRSTGGVTRAMVTGCKKIRNLPLMRYIALTTVLEVKERIPLSENTVIVPIPRSPRAVRDYGFDQAVNVARYMAKELELPCIKALRRRSGRKQKELSFRDRTKNARTVFSLNRKFADRIVDKHIILYDDVVTTGASAITCAKLLFDAGASTVDFVSFAKTER